MVRFCLGWAVVAAVLVLAPIAQAAMPPAEELFPAVTKGFMSIPDVESLREKWQQTSLGQMAKDPLMKEFIDEIESKVEDKLSGKANLKIGVDDLRGIASGEIALGLVQPTGNQNYGQLLVADIAGNVSAAEKLLKTFRADRAADGWAVAAGNTYTSYAKLDKRLGLGKKRYIFHAIVGETLVFGTELTTFEGVLAKLGGKAGSSLSQVTAYQKVTGRVAKEMPAYDAEWFMEPFGYAEAMRASRGGRKGRKTDVLDVLKKEKFTGILGVGGRIALAAGENESLHRTFVYAPGPFQLSARMMQLPGVAGDLVPDGWVPETVGGFVRANWKVESGFEFSKTLVNRLAGDEVFEDVINNQKDDPDGPRVDIRKNFIAQLEDRVAMLNDVKMPVGPESERMLVAIPVKNAAIVAETVSKAMKAEPNAKSKKFAGTTIHYMTEAPAAAVKPPRIGGPGFGRRPKPQAAKKQTIPEFAITVIPAGGKFETPHLLISSHVELIEAVLTGKTSLSLSADFARVKNALKPFDNGKEAIRGFNRNYITQRANYELIRAGKMPESKSFLGRLLNAALGEDDDDELRKPRVAGKKLPPFNKVEKYFGLSGMIVSTEADGWLVTGVTLPRFATPPGDAAAAN